MHNQIEWSVGLAAIVLLLGVLARKLGTPYPILLVLGGLVLATQDGVPTFEMHPDLVFFVFLPPLLYSAAFQTDWNSFRYHLRAITLLAVGLVLVTMVTVAAVSAWLVGLPWQVGALLGAIVAPPDAVAATAILRRLQVPTAVLTIVEGESLVNDATALVAYRMTLAAVLGSGIGLPQFTGQFLQAGLGGIAWGIIAGMLILWGHRELDRRSLVDAKLTIALTLLTPYLIYLPAERFHLSGVLAVVTAGIWVSMRIERVFSPLMVFEARVVWDMLEFLFNGAVFILIGLQLPVVMEEVRIGVSVEWLAVTAAGIAATVILTRIAWVVPLAYLPRWVDRQLFGCQDPYPPMNAVFVVSWAGMRGVVSLAAALAIPKTLPSGEPFPGRDLVQFLTFTTIFVTLVGQGLTLPWIIRKLGVDRLPDA